MRRLLTTILCFAILFLCVLPSYAYPYSDDSQVDYLYVDYNEFHNNRAYYDELLLQGYAIIVSVGDEHYDEEIARFTQAGTNIYELVPSMQRGTTAPTDEIDIHNVNYTFTCDANYQYLYTNYKFYGCEAYLISGFNEDNDNDLRIRVFGTSNGTVNYSVPPRSTIYVHFATGSASQRWFAMFFPPSHAYGNINCILH